MWNGFDTGVPFGGYKMSGIGREKGEAALDHYTQASIYRDCSDMVSKSSLQLIVCCSSATPVTLEQRTLLIQQYLLPLTPEPRVMKLFYFGVLSHM